MTIACTLSVGRVPERLALIGGLVGDALLDQHPIAGGLRSRFRAGRGIERRLREVVELESQCCGFLDFRLTRDEEALALDITGPPDAQPVIEQFFAHDHLR